MSFFSKIFLIFIFIFSFSVNILAATGPGEIAELKEQVYYNTTPQKPNIGDNINIEVEMYGTPIANSNFVWKINGKLFKEGIGAYKISFTLSEKTKVELFITTGSGNTIEKSFEFDPKKIVMVWESKTYTPPFYKGKSLYTPESSLILNALNLDQDNPLTNVYNNYTWSVDNTVKGDESGVGYSSYLFQGNILKSEPLFTVIVDGVNSFKDVKNNKNNSYSNETSLRVQTFPTEIISYEKSPLLGVLFNKTVGDEFILDKNEATLVSYPLYYSLSSSLSGIYSWFVNDVKININSNEISFKKKSENERSRLSLKIKNPESLLQSTDVLYIINTSKK
jgi:hypothetical protein